MHFTGPLIIKNIKNICHHRLAEGDKSLRASFIHGLFAFYKINVIQEGICFHGDKQGRFTKQNTRHIFLNSGRWHVEMKVGI